MDYPILKSADSGLYFKYRKGDSKAKRPLVDPRSAIPPTPRIATYSDLRQSQNPHLPESPLL